jgi:hypothetical protein
MSDLLLGFWDVSVRPDTVTVRRTAKRSDDMPAVLRSFDGIYRALGGTRASDFRMFLDLPAAVGRNDPEFEVALRHRRQELFRSFARSCVLVRTAVGRLQVQRHIEEDGFAASVLVFIDEAEATRWLASA